MMKDKIYIRDLALRCIIGVNEDERAEKQDVEINLIMACDLSAACASDDIEQTVDYKKVKKAIISMVEKSSFFLIERLAEEIAGICLAEPRVQAVTVTVDKPGALRFSRSVAVQIHRGNTI